VTVRHGGYNAGEGSNLPRRRCAQGLSPLCLVCMTVARGGIGPIDSKGFGGESGEGERHSLGEGGDIYVQTLQGRRDPSTMRHEPSAQP